MSAKVKTVPFGSRPGQPQPLPPEAEQWIEEGTKATEEKPVDPPAPAEKDKRMTFDVPADLHRRVKMGCAARGVAIRDVILRLLEAEFPADGKGAQ